MSETTEAEQPSTDKRTELKTITDVYIGVFFDGTNNNMVQKARFTGTGKNIFTKTAQQGWYGIKKGFWYIIDKTPFRDEEDINVNIYEEEKGGYTKQSEGEKGYSNIAILYDNYLLNSDYVSSVNGNNGIGIYKHFYIEGSGAADTSQFISGNPNGLGFGLGDTGVTALVSKAVKYISNYINSLSIEKNVKIHFYVFGFSRGATCARLFSRLVVRGNTDKIKREDEFSEYYAKNYYKNGRLNFLEEFTDKKIEFLGIYDTVVSIGYLKQKDGEVHPILRRLMHGFAPNYKENWHYKNVSEYGLYLSDEASKKIGHICHICAMDEFRENFALTDVGSAVPTNAIEVFVPGCHSDVGGGYIDYEEEQEIILSKYREPNSKPKESNSESKEQKNKPTYFINVTCPSKTELLEKSTITDDLYKLGWIDRNWNTENKMYSLKGDEKIPCTMRIVDGKKWIKFKRKVRGGYSNITLYMMVAYANKMLKKTGCPSLFPKQPIVYYDVPSDLKGMETQMISKMEEMKKGERKWFMPEGAYDSDTYKKLRLKYLHFTSTSKIYHINNIFNFKGVHTIEGTPGNLGNTPNFDETGRLCRIIYHGDKKESSNVSEELHYMHEYNFNIEKVEDTIRKS